MARVEVKGTVLQWALDRSNRSEADLRTRFPKLRQWIAETEQPTLKQLEGLSAATVTPLGFFFLEEPPEETIPIPDYRTMSGKPIRRPSVDLLDTIYAMQNRQSWMRDSLIEEGQSPLHYVGSARVTESAESVAGRMRAVLAFAEDWSVQHKTQDKAAAALREAMESAGVLVVVNSIVGNNTSRPLDPEEFRGFILSDEYAPLVFVNGADAKAAQMFTLAHELAHVFFGSSALFDLRQMMPAPEPVEQACNRVAAEFLVPEAPFRSAWGSAGKNSARFFTLAHRFNVSPIVAARRAVDLHLLEPRSFFAFYNVHTSREFEKKPTRGGDFYRMQPLRVGARFGRAVVNAARGGRISYREAYSLTGLQGSTFERFAQEIDT